MKILPLFIPHQGCPFQCIYCNQHTITKTDNLDLYDFKILIDNFCRKNKETNKEIAFFGGTFTALDQDIQLKYLKLADAHKNELRGVRLSTRPDCISEEILQFLKSNGVSTIELGIQSFDDYVLLASARGYDKNTAINACKMIKDAGFDLIIQLMPGLPGYLRSIFLRTIDQTLNLKPDGVRLYPTLILKNTTLELLFKNNKYQPLDLDTIIDWLKEAYKSLNNANIPIIKTGLHSDIDPKEIIAGPYHPAIGERIKIELLFDDLIANWQKNMTLEIRSSAISLFRGHQQLLINKLKNDLLLDRIPVRINKEPDADLFRFTSANAHKFW